MVKRGEGVEKGKGERENERVLRFAEVRSSGSHSTESRSPTGCGSCQSQCNPVRISPGFIPESLPPPFP